MARKVLAALMRLLRGSSRSPPAGAGSESAQSRSAVESSADGAGAIERLAGGVAHDFNNILLVVRGYTELALAEKDLGPGARDHLQEVTAAVRRASDVIGQLLAVARRAPSVQSEIDVNEAVGRGLEQGRAARGAAVQASFVAGAGLPRLLASADQVERLVASLVAYIMERTPQGGRVSVETGLAPGSEEAGRLIFLRLTETGAAVPDDEKAHLFEPFYVSPVSGRRMGLGLAAARGTVLLLGGQISAHSPPSGGIELEVLVPVRRESPQAPTSAPAGTVLLAEDDAAIRDLASHVLGKEGFRVLAAADGDEAIELFERNKDVIRAAILDEVMPKAGGRAVMDRIRVTRPALPVILCTGYAWGDQESAARPGGEQILPKPYEPRELVRCVRRIMGSAG